MDVSVGRVIQARPHEVLRHVVVASERPLNYVC
ncbi:hypothetical protein Mal4_39570 [Maioricimonas rarisocia]|uniref:Uncharacterized protein n=1 Tax=Maioricimonas rarisocia TaxID=2528026 RepID=A0A517ZB04_9PLAN|nr:hypothetical protein Mal4_39570 [Maioricimonas rarisocia]